MGASSRNASSVRAATLGAVMVTCSVLAVTLPGGVQAHGRDANGSRMLARSIAFPSSHDDHLAPPGDAVDWRFFQLSRAANVAIDVSFSARDADGAVHLTGATGRDIASASARGAKVSVTRRLAPGVYYVSVAARTHTGYTLSLH